MGTASSRFCDILFPVKKRAADVKLIIYDLDGTLLDSRLDIVLAVNATLKHLGLPEKSEELVTSYIGWGSDKLLRDALGRRNLGLLPQAVRYYWRYYLRHGLDNTAIFPGVKPVLRRFSDRIQVIVSNKQRAFVVGQLKAFGIRRYFREVLGGDDMKCAKPSPCPINDMLRKYGIDRREAMIVGDMALDIRTGKNARILTCGVTYGIGDVAELRRSRPDFLISKFPQLREIIR